MRRVVVTGIGMVTPLGLDSATSWQSLLNGKSGVSIIDTFDTTDFSTKIAASVKGFDIENLVHISNKDARKMDRFTQFGIVAAQEAIKDSGLIIDEKTSLRTGVSVGAGIGGIQFIEDSHARLLEGGARKVSPFFIPGTIINMVAGHISILNNLKGPNLSTVTACATGSHNIGIAARMISYGDADVMVAGGVEATITPLAIAGFSAVKSLSKNNENPSEASRPFDKDRDGFVMGEGAGILILESLEHAISRGAKIYAELAGFGMSGDAYHMTAPDREGACNAMKAALQDAKLNPSDIDYINAHGTSTTLNDLNETLAIKSVFKEHATQLAVSSTKSMTGHLLGAAGAVEAAVSILAIKDQVAPPTINLMHPDEECDLDYIPHESRNMKINAVLSNSLGFGGTNATLIFKKYL